MINYTITCGLSHGSFSIAKVHESAVAKAAQNKLN